MGLEGRLKERFYGEFPEFGAIFMSNESTRKECFSKKLLGLPMSSAGFVKGVKVGMILFLFEYEKRQLHGVFKATSDGQLDIVPHAYKSSGKKFPAQVSFTTIWHCHPLPEYEFRDAISDNYFASNRFNFGLSKDQVYRLLSLFGSRKMTSLRSQSIIGSGRERHPKSSHKKRKTEEDSSNQSKSAKKKPKGDVDSISESMVDPLVYSGKLTVERDESQLLDSGDLHISCMEPDSMPCNCTDGPEHPCGQSSLASVASHSSTSGQEWVPHPDHAIQIQPVSVEEEPKGLESSGNFDTDLGDYIPLLQSDDSDSDTWATPEPGSMNDQIILPFSTSGLYEDTCKPGDVPIKENADSDYICHKSVRGLYSDASNDHSNVFSRLNFSSRVQNSDASNDQSSVFSRLNFSSRVQDKEDYTDMDKSAEEIMEELQQMHDQWKEAVGMPGHVGRGNEHIVDKKASVFLRLRWS